MDGIHDMGGMDGFGKVEPEPNEPPFHASWEGRVLAMQRAMGYAGAWHIDMSRFAQERLPPQVYVTASYYQRWALAMERMSSSAVTPMPRNSPPVTRCVRASRSSASSRPTSSGKG